MIGSDYSAAAKAWSSRWLWTQRSAWLGDTCLVIGTPTNHENGGLVELGRRADMLAVCSFKIYGNGRIGWAMYSTISFSPIDSEWFDCCSILLGVDMGPPYGAPSDHFITYPVCKKTPLIMFSSCPFSCSVPMLPVYDACYRQKRSMENAGSIAETSGYNPPTHSALIFTRDLPYYSLQLVYSSFYKPKSNV